MPRYSVSPLQCTLAYLLLAAVRAPPHLLVALSYLLLDCLPRTRTTHQQVRAGRFPIFHSRLPLLTADLPPLLGPAEELPRVVSTAPHHRARPRSTFAPSPSARSPWPHPYPTPAAVEPHLATPAGTRRPSSRDPTRPRRRTTRRSTPNSPISARSRSGGRRALRTALPTRRSSRRPKHERNRAGGPRATGRNRNQRLRRDRVIDVSGRADSQRHPGRLLTHVVIEHGAHERLFARFPPLWVFCLLLFGETPLV